ncbi:hypothetical protein KJ596_04720 [Patescibacteria group bacterium]|nr:hypothetical protein [Patescibacteria group bacterium]MBU1868254.1 hypothetical protein [Patescibacteria group bacterium]
MPSKSAKSNVVPLVIGIIITIIGASVAIGLAIWFTHSASPLWAIILLIWGIERVRFTKREYNWKPAVLGLVMGVAYALLGIVAWYVNDARVLWAMILVNWLGDAIV